MTAIDRKGIGAFLGLTFGITFILEGGLIASGMNMDFGPLSARNALPFYAPLLIGLVMWIPALSTVIVVKYVTREGFTVTNFRLGRWKPYLISAVVVPLLFAAIYGTTWMLGLARPDWELAGLRAAMTARGVDAAQLPDPRIILPGIFCASLILGPLINGLFGFGEEFGWRGYLLPKLMPLGKWKAYVLVGTFWGAWHAPLIVAGFNYPGSPVSGILAMMGMTTALGIYINEMTLRHRSSVLAGWIHGAFNGQFYGVWRLLFPALNPLLGGVTGLVGISVWALFGLAVARRFAKGGRAPEG